MRKSGAFWLALSLAMNLTLTLSVRSVRVLGPSTAGLLGTKLASAVLGLRGGFGSRFGRLSYDLFVRTPVYKPAKFHTAGVTGGMQVAYQY
jgi:hemolysin activation/secretion protein